MSLQPATSDGRPICRKCGAVASVLPGPLYNTDDESLFDQVAAAVGSNLSSERIGQRIVAELRNAEARTDAVQRVMLRVVDDLPALGFLVPALSFRPTTVARHQYMLRASGILLTIVTARVRQLEGRGGLALDPSNAKSAREMGGKGGYEP